MAAPFVAVPGETTVWLPRRNRSIAAVVVGPRPVIPRGPGQQQRFPRARFASDEQHLALALLRAVQQAEDGLELRPAPPHRETLVSHGIPPNRFAVMRHCA
jgi:hypothetical protein